MSARIWIVSLVFALAGCDGDGVALIAIAAIGAIVGFNGGAACGRESGRDSMCRDICTQRGKPNHLVSEKYVCQCAEARDWSKP